MSHLSLPRPSRHHPARHPTRFATARGLLLASLTLGSATLGPATFGAVVLEGVVVGGMVAAAVTLEGCGDPFVQGVDYECSAARNVQCDPGYTCISNWCHRMCDDATQCGSTEACVDSACLPYSATCGPETECISGFYCDQDTGDCRKLSARGEACTSDSRCASSHCVDDRCCEDACEETCWACAAAATGEDDGTCAPVLLDEDPRDDCAGTVACDGFAACLEGQVGDPCTVGGSCADSFCVDGVCCEMACGGSCVACAEGLTGDGNGICAPLLEGLDPDDECTGPTACNGAGACFEGAIATACANGYECLSGSCEDSWCCDTLCSGTCMGCDADLTGLANGDCGPILEGLDDLDDDCLGVTACDGAGACYALGLGAGCTNAYECDGDQCVDSVCCDDACGDECDRCDGMLTGVAAGTCAPIENGEDPEDECADHLTCNGLGTCWGKPEGYTCGDSFECIDGYCCGGACEPPWEPMTVPTSQPLNSIWGTSSTNIWAVGEARTAIRYDGNDWLAVPGTRPQYPVNYMAVSGSGTTVLIVGEEGLGGDPIRSILQYDGQDFVDTAFDAAVPDAPLNDVEVLADNDAIAVGDNCNIIRWDGAIWTPMTCPSPGGADLSAAKFARLWRDGADVYTIASLTETPPPPLPATYRTWLLKLENTAWVQVGPEQAGTSGIGAGGLAAGTTWIVMGGCGVGPVGFDCLYRAYRLEVSGWEQVGGVLNYAVHDATAVGDSLFLATGPIGLSGDGHLVHVDRNGTGVYVDLTTPDTAVTSVWSANPCLLFATVGTTVYRR